MKDRATRYAEQVLRDRDMGAEHILSCERHLRDLERQNTPEFPYIWRPEKSERILNFAESLVLAEGAEPRPLILRPHQCYDIGSLFGWVHVDTGFRRFRRNYQTMARQNGKSLGNGILGTYIAGFCGYNHGRLFTAATKKRQSKVVWEEILKFIQADKDLEELFRVQEWRSIITCKETMCTIEALSKEGGLDEGFRSIFASLDELQQMKDGSVYSNLYRGTRALDETLVSMITTRTRDVNSFAFDMDRYAVKILEGVVSAHDMFVDVYCADKDDGFFTQEALRKANPYLWNTEQGRNSLLEDAQTARDMGGSEMAEYCAKTLNIWYSQADNGYVDINAWMECGSDLTLEDMRGRECFVGVDMSSGGDLTSIGFDFELEDGKAYIESHSFIPRGRLHEHIQSDLAPYDVWEQKELITVTGGSGDHITDHLAMWEYLHQVVDEYNLKLLGIGYDRHNIATSLTYMEDFGCPVMEVPQSARWLNDATLDLQLRVKSKKLVHNIWNELLTYSFANAETVKNSFGEIKIEKRDNKRNRRIDPVDAAINARAMRLANKPTVDLNAKILSEDWSL